MFDSSFFRDIAALHQADPLAPMTVIVPSHIAGIQLRRRLAEHGAFAAVRFETLPRIAELLGAGDLARSGRKPLARPIADYVAAEVAREARSELAGVRELPGFARVLRQAFRRLRRGGFRRAEEVPISLEAGLLAEVVRLYSLFRARTSAFYDDEDLLDAATIAVEARPEAIAQELGEIFVLPPGGVSAGADRLLTSIRRAAGRAHYHLLADTESQAKTRFVLAPDPASEAREVAREVLSALEAGYAFHEIAVFHGADPAYRTLLDRALANASIPVSAMPGSPLTETAAGRGVLALAELPLHDFSRTKTIDCLGLAPLRQFVPAGDRNVPLLPALWRRLAREAGITQGLDRWSSGLTALADELVAAGKDREEDDERRLRFEAEAQQARDLRDVIETLAQSLEPLRHHQPAARFIESFRTIVEAYFEPSAVLSAAIGQIDQLGTIDAVGGGFTLESFAGALRANLDAARYRESSVGEGVLVGDYRLAAGLSFRHAIICGAYEGVFPAGPGVEPLVEDRFWQELRRSHPLLEDAALRSERAQDQARRAISCAGEELVLTAPLQAGAAGRDHYPSHLMLDAARGHDAGLESASQLRRAPASAWLRRSPSPLAAILTGRPVDVTEMRLRTSVVARREGRPAHAGHPLSRALAMLTARRGAAFSAFDGNLAELGGDDLIPSGAVSPTSLEYYATCGFRYYLRSVLRLHPPDEPDDRETIDPLERGSIVHNTLDEFFKLQLGRGRPAVNEPWNEADRVELLDILERHLDEARQRGKTGLDVFAEHERRRLRADMSAFLDKDTEFRLETGARPEGFEVPLPEVEVAGLRMRGFVDRIDRTEDGKKAWVIDYKTGSISSYEGMKDDDPLMGGTKLQLPVYLAAVQGADATPLYWFISGAAGFARKEFRTTPENLQRFDETLAAILDGLKRGVFPPVSGDADDFFGGWKNCQWCDFKRLCSRRRDDEFEAKKDDPTLAPWLRVGATARGEAP